MVVAMRERTEQPEASRRVQTEHGPQNRPGRERRERGRAKEERGPGV